MFYLDEEDFDVSEVSVTFLANEDVVRPTTILVPIPVVDDNKDEADEQLFIVYLEAIGMNPEWIEISRKFSICRITDNDGESIQYCKITIEPTTTAA